jgi:hypothetical protein
LESSIELTSRSFLLGKNEDLFGATDFFDLHSDLSTGLLTRRKCKDLLAMLLNGKNAVEFNEVVTSFLRFASGLSFGAGLSIAVLINAHGLW